MDKTIFLKITERSISIDNGWITYIFYLTYFALWNTLEEEKFKLLINSAIREREEFILKKNSMEIDADYRTALVLNSSSMISSKYNTF